MTGGCKNTEYGSSHIGGQVEGPRVSTDDKHCFFIQCSQLFERCFPNKVNHCICVRFKLMYFLLVFFSAHKNNLKTMLMNQDFRQFSIRCISPFLGMPS